MNSINLTDSFPVIDFVQIKQKVLNWLLRFDTFCFLDNHQYQIEPHTQECLVAAGVRRKVVVDSGTALAELQALIDEKQAWLFGHLGYDLKNEILGASSSQPDFLGFADLHFFEPEIVVRFDQKSLTIEAVDPAAVYREIDTTAFRTKRGDPELPGIHSRLTQAEYISIIEQLQRHILRGDCYEINYCQEFFSEEVKLDPVSVYSNMAELSPNPFSALYRTGDQWLICASPERFLRKEKERILSQPIKGTSRRALKGSEQDERERAALSSSPKDRSENVMIVDLVRNDLSRVCKKGSVKVDELFGIYSFPQVHQMISTVSGELDQAYSFTDIIRATFPMGSMTGAPKERVIGLIEQYEKTRRGIFSGALGYLSPTGDFDFNVVIRSIMYNASSGYLSFQAGSAITYYSDPQQEWEECLLKAEAIRHVLSR